MFEWGKPAAASLTPPAADSAPPPAAQPPNAQPPNAQPATAQPAGAQAELAPEADEHEATVVSTKERYLPGSEPHSAGTLGHAYNDPLNLRYSAAAFGGSGLLHLSGADLGPRRIIRFSAVGEYTALGDYPLAKERTSRAAGSFSFSFSPIEILEVYTGYQAAASTTLDPNLTGPVQTNADLVIFGAKFSRQWLSGLYAGGELRFGYLTGNSNQGVGGTSLGVYPQAIGTYDLLQRYPKVPLRLHANVGFALDGTGVQVPYSVSTVQSGISLGLNRYPRFTLGVGVESPLPGASPFIELGFFAPMGGGWGPLTTVAGTPVSDLAAIARQITFGAKVTAIEDLTLVWAIDVGLFNQPVVGLSATLPVNLFIGASFNIDPFQKGETRLVETVRERKIEPVVRPPPASRVSGVVLDARTHQPIAGAVITVGGGLSAPSATESATGRYLTQDIPSGVRSLTASRDGYLSVTQEVLLEPGKVQPLDFELEPMLAKSRIAVTVTYKKKPVASKVVLKGPEPKDVWTTESAKEPFKVDVAPGQYEATVNADGFLAQTRDLQVSPGGELSVSFELVPQPKKKLVVVTEKKIEILQQIHFASGKSTILPDSYNLLFQVIDAIIKNHIRRVRIEGHTDNKGPKAFNLKLSQDRAESVANFLIHSGIEKGRLEWAGYGDSRPIAPNLTAQGRQLNRRVEFLIVEQ